MFDFTEDEIRRYSRHILLPEVGGKGQKKINGAKVLMVGAGGLGAPIGYYLAAAGVGKIGIVDGDHVELSNLQRQIVHSTEDLGKNKAISAQETLLALNPDIEVNTFQERVASENIFDILEDYEIVVDGSDNFPTRYLVNDACVLTRKPLSHGAVFRFHGQAMTIVPGEGPCYRCLFREPPPPGMVASCQEAGVLGVLPGLIGLIQATEVLKLILGAGEVLKGRLMIYEALEMEFKNIKVQRDPYCPVCGDHPTITKLIDYEEFCRVNF
ncbi:MAG: molybdopterin-synthase adenylyltransferase MoeB [Desulfatiglandales bacterium]|jgi:adenylyltransferase/sulfurtransferase|nr:molybdopterin-synthase adenylyltransferase MoeB [Desulfatiglandales bacterium]